MGYRDFEDIKSGGAKSDEANRIDNLIRIINFAMINPKEMNPQFMEYNWKVWFNADKALFTNVNVKKATEKAKFNKWENKLRELLKKFPVNSEVNRFNKTGEIFNYDILDLFIEALDKFHLFIMELVHKYQKSELYTQGSEEDKHDDDVEIDDE